MKLLAQGFAWLVAFVVPDAASVPANSFSFPHAPSGALALARVVRVS